MNDLYYYINYKYGSNIKSDEEFLDNLLVIPLLQEYDTVLSHSNVKGLNLTPSGDIYLKYNSASSFMKLRFILHHLHHFHLLKN